MQESPKVLYIGTPSGTKSEAGHLAKSAGIARYAEARGWNVVPVAWARDLRRKMPAIIREEHPAGCIVECSAALGPWLPPPLFAGIPTVWLDCRDGVFGPGVPTVVCDQGAVVRQAFGELQSLRPAALAPAETWAPEHRPFVIGGTASGGESGWREFCNEVKRIENTAR